MTMVILLFFLGVGREEEVCGGGHGMSAKEEEAIFFRYLRRREGRPLPPSSAATLMPSKTKILLQPIGSDKVAMAYAIIFYMVIFVPSSVQSCGGDHGLSSREEEVYPSDLS